MSWQIRRDWRSSIPSFSLTTTMVKSNTQNKSSATNAHPFGPQATSTSVSEFPDSLNIISCASSRAGKHVHPKGRSCACRTVRRSSRSVSAAENFRKASPEPFSSFFFFQKFITRCLIAVRGRLSTTSSLHRPQGPDCPIIGRRHYQYQRRNLT